MRTEAYLSSDRAYRYWLLRVWDPERPLFCTFGINPSTADEKEDDPTIRKEIGFGSRLGFGGLLKLNVGAFRATDPRGWRQASDPFGPENTVYHLLGYVEKFSPTLLVAAWGKNGNYAKGRCEEITDAFPNLKCWGCNSDGTPRHSLMLPYSTPLVEYRNRTSHG